MTKLELHLAALAACGIGTAAPELTAALIQSGIVNINIPSNVDGVYLNVVTGITGSSSGATPGWDVNPWSATGLGLFSPINPSGGAYVVSAPGFAINLGIGSFIGPANTFGSGTAANTAMWNLNSTNNHAGFRFFNEATGQIHYGWMRLAFSSTIIAQPRTIVEYAYESTPGMQAWIPWPTPGTATALLIGGGMMSRRRRFDA